MKTKQWIMAAVALVAVGGLAYFIHRTTAFPADIKPPASIEVTIDTPPGWTSKIDAENEQLVAAEGPLDAPEPMVLLTVKGSRVVRAFDTEKLATGFVGQLTARGLTVKDAPTPATIAGMPGHFVMAQREPGDEICAWLVKRSPFVLETVQCAVHGYRSCKSACQLPIDRLRWPP